eukprot:GFYU01001635.1.p1 GENE.GFYU01001635.1~~GFYU01001635.1.p1  ORF type:complete len:207 (-),score=25.46 GFYU01001635.1:60-680(-)
MSNFFRKFGGQDNPPGTPPGVNQSHAPPSPYGQQQYAPAPAQPSYSQLTDEQLEQHLRQAQEEKQRRDEELQRRQNYLSQVHATLATTASSVNNRIDNINETLLTDIRQCLFDGDAQKHAELKQRLAQWQQFLAGSENAVEKEIIKLDEFQSSQLPENLKEHKKHHIDRMQKLLAALDSLRDSISTLTNLADNVTHDMAAYKLAEG